MQKAESVSGKGWITWMAWVRYYYQPAVQLISLGLLALGGLWIWLIPLAIFFLTTFIDELSPGHEEAEEPSRYSELPLFLTACLAVIIAAVFVIMASLSLGAQSNPNSLTVLVGEFFGPQPIWALIGAALGVGMLLAAAFNIGHELSHRLDSRLRLFFGQVICTLSLHSCFPIEHIYGHHRNVGTHLDPTTARRGEPFWLFMPRSFFGTYRNAFRIAGARAARHSGFSRVLKNRAVQGIVIQLVLFFCAFALGGWMGLSAYLVATVIALLIVELFQYVGHYGLIRVPGAPVRAAHAWELSGTGSSSFTVNLTCHSAHHVSGDKPFWQLRLTHQAPTLPLGPFPVLVIAMIPPLYFRLTKPALDEWDRTLATPEEHALAIETRKKQVSGIHLRTLLSRSP
ncbi:MAG: fatty acid desaturase [Phyllobacteriaceae bacterium]|jgi:alkane 1-monooxygenase|nr:fatty acid desaturase [Phyllobacteriaceae bacterium]